MVTSVEFEPDRDTSLSRCALATASWWAGKTYTVYSSSKGSRCSWGPGQPVAVAYDPTYPIRAMIPDTEVSRYFLLAFGGVGAFMVMGSLFPFVASVVRGVRRG